MINNKPLSIREKAFLKAVGMDPDTLTLQPDRKRRPYGINRKKGCYKPGKLAVMHLIASN